jgi:hypothetical protein
LLALNSHLSQSAAIPAQNFAHSIIVSFSWKIVPEAKFELLVSRGLKR